MVEAYAVLTRLPAGLAVAAAPAADVLTRRFPDAPLRLSAGQQRTLIQRLADVGVLGGSSYDGIIALEAQAHEQTLMTLDRRAHETYLRLGVATRLVGASG